MNLPGGEWILRGKEKAKNTQVQKFGGQISPMLCCSKTALMIRAHGFPLCPVPLGLCQQSAQ